MVNPIVPPSAGTFSEAATCQSSVSAGRISKAAVATPDGNVATKFKLVPLAEIELMTGASAGTAAHIWLRHSRNIPTQTKKLHRWQPVRAGKYIPGLRIREQACPASSAWLAIITAIARLIFRLYLRWNFNSSPSPVTLILFPGLNSPASSFMESGLSNCSCTARLRGRAPNCGS